MQSIIKHIMFPSSFPCEFGGHGQFLLPDAVHTPFNIPISFKLVLEY